MNEKEFDIKNFWERVKKLCRFMSVTQKDFALGLGLKVYTIQNQINHDIHPRLDQLVKMADYFNVSLDYLITGKETAADRDSMDMANQLTENIKKRIDTKDFRLDRSLKSRRGTKIETNDILETSELEEIKELSTI